MELNDRIFVAGARGLVGSAIVRRLKAAGYQDVLAPSSAELDLTNQAAVNSYMERMRPDYVFIAAAKVGGIWANSNYPAEFIHINLAIQTNLIHACYEMGVRKMLFLGSSCIYPKDSEIPIKESSLLTGPLEPTNEAYAIAKIAGVKMCDYYRKQYGCDFITAMPTNTFGPHDNYDLRTSHMIPALIHKFHLAKIKKEPYIQIWGSGNPRRELIYVDDVADACLFLMDHYSEPGPINIGSGEDYSVKEIAQLIQKEVGFEGELTFDLTKPDGVYRKVMDVSRILNLGWKPKVSLNLGMKQAYEWFEKHYDSVAIHPSYKKEPLIFKSAVIASKIKHLLIQPQLLNRGLDDYETTLIHRETILRKSFLKQVYEYHYSDFEAEARKIKNQSGLSLELGSGGGFLKQVMPDVITSDVKPWPGVDQVESAYQLSFKDNQLKAIYMTGVLHHLGNPRAFFKEAMRCLKPGGVIVMMEPHMSLFGRFFFKRLHHEHNDYKTRRWEFPQVGQLSDANTALANIIFDRDLATFTKEFPGFKIVSRKYHTFLLYGLSGGVGFRFSTPGIFFRPVWLLEKLLTPFMRKFLGTMQTIVLEKRPG